MKFAPMSFDSQLDIKDFVECSESQFEEELKKTITDICESDPKFIGLTGPSCSGKTTVSQKIINYAEKQGKRIKIISIDDYYFDREKLISPSDPNIDLDSEKTIDIAEIGKIIEGIKDGKPVSVPKYNFIKGIRTGYTEFNSSDYDLFLFEGIQVLYPKVFSLFPHKDFKGIFINTESDLKVGDILFDHNEIRLMRRIVRDYFFRNASCELTFSLWDGVRKNEDQSIYPFSHLCSYHIDSVLPFEVHLLKPYLIDILSSVNADSRYYQNSAYISEKIESISPINKKHLSSDTMYREFIPIS